MFLICYKKDTGEAWQQVEYPDNLPGDFSHIAPYIISTSRVAFPGYVEDGDYFELPPAPDEFHHFDFLKKIWVDPRTLDDLKYTKWGQVKSARSTSETSGFTWSGSTFDSDPISQQRIQGAAQLATLAMINSQPFSIDWTLADNSVRTLNAQEMIAVCHAMVAHINQCHQQGRALRALIEAATTKEEVEAITWNSLA